MLNKFCMGPMFTKPKLMKVCNQVQFVAVVVNIVVYYFMAIKAIAVGQ